MIMISMSWAIRTAVVYQLTPIRPTFRHRLDVGVKTSLSWYSLSAKCFLKEQHPIIAPTQPH